MSLVAGTATGTVDADGNVTMGGTGLAATIAAAWQASSVFWSNPSHVKPAVDVQGIPAIEAALAGSILDAANAIAAGIVAALTTDAVVTVPISTNELASGVPASPTNLAGTIG